MGDVSAGTFQPRPLERSIGLTPEDSRAALQQEGTDMNGGVVYRGVVVEDADGHPLLWAGQQLGRNDLRLKRGSVAGCGRLGTAGAQQQRHRQGGCPSHQVLARSMKS